MNNTTLVENLNISSGEIYEEVPNDVSDLAVCMDFTYSLETRIIHVLKYYKNGGELHELLGRLTSLYFFSSTTRIFSYIKNICSLSELPISERLECVKQIDAYDVAYSVLEKEYTTFKLLETSSRLNTIYFICNSGIDAYIEKCIGYLVDILKDPKHNSLFKLKLIQRLHVEITAVETFKTVAGALAPLFIADSSNNIMHKIVLSQYMIVNKIGDLVAHLDFLTHVAEDETNVEDTRADACDVLIKYSDDKQRVEALLYELAGGNLTRNNIFKNKQNVHTSSIEKSIHTMLEKISSYNLTLQSGDEKSEDKNIDYEKVKDLLLLKYPSDSLKLSLERIEIDNIKYGTRQDTLSAIIVKLWVFLKNHTDSTNMALGEERLVEELVEASGKCSSGFVARMMNCMSGVIDGMGLSIGFEDQFIAQLENKLNKRIMLIEDVDQRDLILDEMTIDQTKPELRANFLEFFRKHISAIRDLEFYQEYKGYMADEDFDLYFRKALAHYEGY